MEEYNISKETIKIGNKAFDSIIDGISSLKEEEMATAKVFFKIIATILCSKYSLLMRMFMQAGLTKEELNETIDNLDDCFKTHMKELIDNMNKTFLPDIRKFLVENDTSGFVRLANRTKTLNPHRGDEIDELVLEALKKRGDFGRA